MSISNELAAKILRYHYVEKWRIHTISTQLGVHHSTIKRVLSKGGVPSSDLVPSRSMIIPYLPFLLDTLKKYPTLTAQRLYEMVRERGYQGGPDHFRHLIALYRPKKVAEAYLRLRTLPGEQGQVDWGSFGYHTVGQAKRPLMAFVMVLSFSRKIFLRFYLNQRMANFLRGHQAAFAAWGGLPRVLLYDNLRSAVLERQGDAIRFNPTLLAFSAHYRFEPRPVAVARGNEKGRVERAIRYVRDNFFAGRHWTDLDDLNQQALQWCDGVAADRPCPEDRSQSVRTQYEKEQPRLIALPDNPYPSDEREEVKVGKTPYVRFDWNDYSIPHTHVRRTLTVVAKPDQVMILDGADVIAKHLRSYDKGQQIEEASHLRALIHQKKKARQHRGQHRLTQAMPSGGRFLEAAAKANYSLRSVSKQLTELLESYGAAELEMALQEALQHQVPHPNAVRLSLERRREARQQPPPIALTLSADSRVKDLVIRPHDLENYDQLCTSTTATETNDDPQ